MRSIAVILHLIFFVNCNRDLASAFKFKADDCENLEARLNSKCIPVSSKEHFCNKFNKEFKFIIFLDDISGIWKPDKTNYSYVRVNKDGSFDFLFPSKEGIFFQNEDNTEDFILQNSITATGIRKLSTLDGFLFLNKEKIHHIDCKTETDYRSYGVISFYRENDGEYGIQIVKDLYISNESSELILWEIK